MMEDKAAVRKEGKREWCGMTDEPNILIFEKNRSGKRTTGYVPSPSSEAKRLIPDSLARKKDAIFPEVSEREIVQHFLRLSQKNFSVDTHFYPLGSCTMKYNPKINEEIANHPSFTGLHPYQPEESVQGILRIFWELEEWLKGVTGMDRFSLQPAAGAHGELVGMMIARAYHDSRRDFARRQVIVPDSSHGTNPASAAFYGFEVITIPSDPRGRVNLAELAKAVSEKTACLMMTNPNTLGLFEDDILKIQKMMHEKGALLYYDGANMNALLGIARPGDMGFDMIHLNLHKTFSTPHGGGGPGAGPVGVKKALEKFLPVPLVTRKGDRYGLDDDLPDSIGRVKAFYGNAGILLRAYVYMRRLGKEGLEQVSRDAVLSANYLKKNLQSALEIPHGGFCMHEFVASSEPLKRFGVTAGNIGKRLLDYGIHAPTVYFPLIVKEALMVEPTETESKETLDRFCEVIRKIVRESEADPECLKNAPHCFPVSHPDEVKAAREPLLTYRAFLGRQDRRDRSDLVSGISF